MGGGNTERSRTEELTDLLKDLEAAAPTSDPSVVASMDGVMTAPALPQCVEERVAAMSAPMVWLNVCGVDSLQGACSISSSTRKGASQGIVVLDMKHTAEYIAEPKR